MNKYERMTCQVKLGMSVFCPLCKNQHVMKWDSDGELCYVRSEGENVNNNDHDYDHPSITEAIVDGLRDSICVLDPSAEGSVKINVLHRNVPWAILGVRSLDGFRDDVISLFKPLSNFDFSFDSTLLLPTPRLNQQPTKKKWVCCWDVEYAKLVRRLDSGGRACDIDHRDAPGRDSGCGRTLEIQSVKKVVLISNPVKMVVRFCWTENKLFVTPRQLSNPQNQKLLIERKHVVQEIVEIIYREFKQKNQKLLEFYKEWDGEKVKDFEAFKLL